LALLAARKRLRLRAGTDCSTSGGDSDGALAARIAEATTSKGAIIGSL
jgi:hypothetical protein